MFENHPLLIYTLQDEYGDKKDYILTDLLIDSNITLTNADIVSLTNIYTVTQGERPEQVSDTLYGTPEYYHIILMINNIHDVHTEWYLSESQVRAFAEAKYGTAVDKNAYIIDDYGNTISALVSDDPRYTTFVLNTLPTPYTGNTTTITNYDYEVMQNNKKQNILVPKPDQLHIFAAYYKNKVIANA